MVKTDLKYRQPDFRVCFQTSILYCFLPQIFMLVTATRDTHSPATPEEREPKEMLGIFEKGEHPYSQVQ